MVTQAWSVVGCSLGTEEISIIYKLANQQGMAILPKRTDEFLKQIKKPSLFSSIPFVLTASHRPLGLI